MQLARTNPWLSRIAVRLMGFGVHYAPRFVIKQAIAALPAPDQAMLTQPEFQQGFIAMVRKRCAEDHAGPSGIPHLWSALGISAHRIFA